MTLYKTTFFYKVCQKYEVWRSSNYRNTRAHQNKYTSLVSVQFLWNSAVTETTGCEPWGLTKECGQVDVAVRYLHMLLHILHHAVRHLIYCTT